MKSNKSILLMTVWLLILTFIFNTAIIYAEGGPETENIFSEEGLFSEDIFVEEESIVSGDAAGELEKEGLGISTEVRAAASYNQNDLEKGWLAIAENDSGFYTARLSADLLFDVRLKNRIKLFWDLEVSSDYSENNGEYSLDYLTKEFFVDIPYKNRIYIKAGKQVLKWGRSYFWNPTDLINVEKKDLSNLDKNQGGIKGIKVHIPYGVEKNIYLFLNTDEIDSIEDSALSGKYEFLMGNTEMAFSAWLAKEARAVYGFDISGRVSEIDLRGEISLSKGDNYYKMDYETFEVKKDNESWLPRISAGFTRFFDHGDVTDRISVSGEVYYNSNGYSRNIYQRIDGIADPVARQAVKMRYLQDVYQANLNSKYYAAFFTRYNEFLDPDISLALNGIINLVDGSKTISTGINYQPVTNLSINLDLIKLAGDKNTEYALSGIDYSINLGTSYRF